MSLALAGLATPSSALPPGRLSAPRAVGTVDTVAGPGFCVGPARPDPDSTGVGALAADSSGVLWFESGAPAKGMLTKVSGSSVPVQRSDLAKTNKPNKGAKVTSTSASLLTSNRNGGLLLASSTAIIDQEANAAIAGTAATAGAGAVAGPAGDGGPLRAARFDHIYAIATDGAGNVYVADRLEGDDGRITIRFLNRSDGPVTFYAGTPHERTVAAGTIDTIAGAPGSPSAPLVVKVPVMAVASGRLYLGSTTAASRGEVRMLNLGGAELAAHAKAVPPAGAATVATVTASRAAGGSRRAPALGGITADEAGNLFLTEPANHRVQRVDPAGVASTFAGTGVEGFDGNDRPATRARLHRPLDVEVGAGGRIYISDAGNSQVRLVDQAGIIRAAPGNGTTNKWLCGPSQAPGAAPASTGPPPSTDDPTAVAVDADGSAYLSSSKVERTLIGLGRVHRLGPSGSLKVIAGTECKDRAGCRPGDTVAPIDAVVAPQRLESRPGGGLYVMEQSRVRFLNPGKRPVTAHGVTVPAGAMRAIAGEPTLTEANRPVPTTTSPTIPPIPTAPPPTIPDGRRAITDDPGVTFTDVLADARGNMMVSEVPQGPFYLNGGSIRQIDSRGTISTLVGRPKSNPPNVGDQTECCVYPAGLAIDATGNLYIADLVGNRVWFLNRSAKPKVVHGVNVAAGKLERVAGAGSTLGSREEGIPALEAQLSGPSALTLDPFGNLYVADLESNSVHRVDAAGVIATVVGTGQPGFNGDGLKGPLTALNRPMDLALDACGNLLVVDSANDRVRRLNLVAPCRGPGRAPRPDAGGSGAWRYGAGVAGLGLAALGAFLLSRRRRRRPGPGTR